jgi:histidinol-phosphate aminotransferase
VDMSRGCAANRDAGGVIDHDGDVVLLDQARNPYGPCPAALEAVERCPAFPDEKLTSALRRRLSGTYGVPTAAIHLVRSADGGLVDSLIGHTRPLVAFPPSKLASRIAAFRPESEIVFVARGPGREGYIGPEAAADLPENGIAVIDSPSDPLGSVLSMTDAVRLSRACQYVVIDERFAEFSGVSMTPLALEFDNVVVLRSFEAWAGIQHPSCAWAVASPRSAADLNLEHAVLEPESIMAALATLDNLASVRATLQLIREERSRLYRLLRKLSFLEPVPSWAPFLAARVQIGQRDEIVDGLMARRIRVHAPTDPGLERYIRFGIGSPTAMDRLRTALLDLAPLVVG